MAQLDIVDGAGLLVSDAMTGKTAVVFSGCDDARLVPWLSRPYPGVLVPDVKAAPRILKLADRFILTMPATALMEAVRPLLSRAATRLEAFTETTRETATKIASIVTSTGGMYRGGEIASPGTPGRHFIRLCSTLFDALSSSDIGAGRRAIGSWIENCRAAWASVFSPVLRFFEAFSPLVFSHPICLEPPRPLAKLEITGPANVLSLALDRQKSTTTLRPQVLRLNMTRFA
jgi:hypothetical protein